MSNPTIGRIVHYRLSEQDVARLRDGGRDVGNEAHAGDVYPAMVVRTFGGTAANLQVFLDGPDTLWVTSRDHDEDTLGCWFWPPRLDMTREGR